MTRRHLALAAAAATGVQVGAAMVASRYVVVETGPATLACLRYVIGALFLLPVLLTIRRTRFAARDVLPVCLLGIGQFGVLVGLLNLALLWITAAQAAIVFATMPLQAMLLSAAWGRETLTIPLAVGVLLTVGGVAVTVGEEALAGGLDRWGWLGIAAAASSAGVGALCSVLYRPYLERYPAVQVSTLAMAASVLFLAPFAVPEGLFDGWPSFTGIGWAAILFIGVSSGIGFFLWLFALGNAPPTRVTLFLALNPPTAAVLGALFLAEPLGLGVIGGLALTAAGLWMATRQGATVPRPCDGSPRPGR